MRLPFTSYAYRFCDSIITENPFPSRLLGYNDEGEFSLTDSFGDETPHYAILSHTWEAEEVTFKDLMDDTGKGKAGYHKIQFCGEQARRDGLQYFWVDTCCIDKSSSAELAEAINSMFQWYSRAVKCYAYLSDVSVPDHAERQPTWESDFRNSRWFTRGWTLQELIAPASVEFFSSNGKRLGDRTRLVQQIHEITGIASGALQGASLNVFSVEERLSWAAKRQTSRKEDKAYCLLGIFNIYLPPIYGEGDNAFVRLKAELAKPSTRLDSQPTSLPYARDELAPAEVESISGENSSDEAQEVEDAATVLEFLAWGRLKDSNLTSGLRDASAAHENVLYPDKDIIQTTQAWGLSPSSVSASHMTMETLQISQIQEMLPEKEQVMLLFEYHADWLLFMHCSFYVQTFRRELEQFYNNDSGIISRTSSGLQWAALLFAIMCGSMTCAKPAQVAHWRFNQDDQSVFAKQWYHASIECLNTARYQQNHSLYSVQTIASSTICAHILGFSNSQSVLLASAVRVAHSLGLHRLSRPKKGANDPDGDNLSETIQKEVGRRVWQQLATQDWFSVPFSETYCVNPLHFTTKPPLHCDEQTMQSLPLSNPTIASYGNFLHRVAALMPALQDRISQAPPNAKYYQVLHFDRLMRDLVTTQLPSCLNSQTTIDPLWPPYVKLARRCLTITSAHKIIMIHRRFLGMSFHDNRYAFTRRTCLAAAKTIINEMKEDTEAEFPNIWTTQAFSVAAAIILSLDNFNRHQSAREYAEHRQLVSQTIEYLSSSISVSSIASRGIRLLTDLLAEKHNINFQNGDGAHSSQKGKERANDRNTYSKPSERSLNVAAFVKKFCESDQPQPGNSAVG